MASVNLSTVLQRAFPLIRTHGFTRTTLSLAVASPNGIEGSSEPLSDRAVSALFGEGDEARKTLINAWLDEGLRQMGQTPCDEGSVPSVRDALKTRLAYNKPELSYLPEVYALLASPRLANPPLDVAPALRHVSRVAEQACRVSGDESLHLWWYARRGSLATIYGAAELHQLASPETAPAFLDSLLDGSGKLKSAADEAALYSDYIIKSWKGIFKSYGVL
jgi:ubiquinone biosynthesis protein COQ9